MSYRSEIDGLRAIAIIPVIFYHARIGIFEGGYTGVDVFFVISGYLITNNIISELDAKKFSLINFYERRARRLLPALFFVILISLPFAWFWLPPNHLQNYGESLIYVSTFTSNIFFLLKHGYFSSISDLSPFLNTWRLAVEEQYY